MNNYLEFSVCWPRILESTNISNLSELADLVDVSQPTVSRNKKKNTFPRNWAIIIGYKSNIHPEWIMTGKGPIRNDTQESSYQNNMLHEIDRWLADLTVNEPFRKEWFIGVFLDAFPKFKKWKNNQDNVKNKDNTPGNSKAA